MCGRFSQALPSELMVRLFGAVDRRSVEPAPCWNVAPTQSATAVAWDAEFGRRVLIRVEWGLIPSWERVPDLAKVRPINARCETLQQSRLFGPAFLRRRCIVPVDA